MQRVKCVRLYAAKSNGNAKIDLLQDVIYILKRTRISPFTIKYYEAIWDWTRPEVFVWQYGQTLRVGCFILPYVSSPVAFDGGELVCYSCHLSGHFHVSLDICKKKWFPQLESCRSCWLMNIFKLILVICNDWPTWTLQDDAYEQNNRYMKVLNVVFACPDSSKECRPSLQVRGADGVSLVADVGC